MEYTSEMKKIFGENIWRRRELLGLTREELGKMLGTTRYSVSDWELGKTVPLKEKIRKMSQIFNCSINDLHRAYRMPILSMKKGVIEEKVQEEPAHFVDNLSYDVNVLSDRLMAYLDKNDLSIYEFSKISKVSAPTLSRIKNKKMTTYTQAAQRVEEILNELENKIEEVNKVEEVKEIKTVEEVIEPIKGEIKVQEEPKQEIKNVEKDSISDRLNALTETLLNSLGELDEIKAEVTKLSKVSALLKEIQGL